MLTAIAVAVGGRKHWLMTTKVRLLPPVSDGPPRGPAGLRVSTIRQGVNVWNDVPTIDGGVGVGVTVGVGDADPVGVGVGVGDGVGVAKTTSNWAIMPSSSCSIMWQ